MIKDTIEHSIP